MVSRRSFLGLLPVLAAAPTLGTKSNIRWAPCVEHVDSVLPVDWGRLQVPLDYTDPDAGPKLGLEMLRVPAVTQPARGSIMLNFGGPGLEARKTLAQLSSVLQA